MTKYTDEEIISAVARQAELAVEMTLKGWLPEEEARRKRLGEIALVVAAFRVRNPGADIRGLIDTAVHFTLDDRGG
jgi:hypothetical protein